MVREVYQAVEMRLHGLFIPLTKLFISYGVVGLFAIGLISSVIPIPTEPVVFGLLDVGKNPEVVLITLTVSSILGATIGYFIGKYELRRIIPFHDKEKEKRMQMYFRKYGALLLFISPWVPVLGDIAPMVAGVENYELKRFLIVISAAKVFKSIVIVYALVYLSIKLINWWVLIVK